MKDVTNKNARGFTLIELLVVISIIGLLASIVLVSLNSARQKGKDAAVIEEAHQLKNLFELERGSGSDYSTTYNAISALQTTSGSDYLYTFTNSSQCNVSDTQFANICKSMLANSGTNAPLIIGAPISSWPKTYSISVLLSSTQTYSCYGSNGQNSSGSSFGSSNSYGSPGCPSNP